jgi:hypothetical protein
MLDREQFIFYQELRIYELAAKLNDLMRSLMPLISNCIPGCCRTLDETDACLANYNTQGAYSGSELTMESRNITNSVLPWLLFRHLRATLVIKSLSCNLLQLFKDNWRTAASM